MPSLSLARDGVRTHPGKADSQQRSSAQSTACHWAAHDMLVSPLWSPEQTFNSPHSILTPAILQQHLNLEPCHHPQVLSLILTQNGFLVHRQNHFFATPLGFFAPLSSVTFVWAFAQMLGFQIRAQMWANRSPVSSVPLSLIQRLLAYSLYTMRIPHIIENGGNRKRMKETHEERERAAREEKESKEQEYRRNKGTENQRKRRGNVKVKYQRG